MKPKYSGGFTLIEMIFVILIIGSLIALSVPSLNATRAMVKLNFTTREIVAHLRQVHQQAIATHMTHEVSFYRGQPAKYVTVGTQMIELPPGLNFQADKMIRFLPSGWVVPGGTIIVEDKRGQTKKIVISNVGRVRTE